MPTKNAIRTARKRAAKKKAQRARSLFAGMSADPQALVGMPFHKTDAPKHGAKLKAQQQQVSRNVVSQRLADEAGVGIVIAGLPDHGAAYTPTITDYRNGSKVEVIPGATQHGGGPHIAKLYVDEIELSDVINPAPPYEPRNGFVDITTADFGPVDDFPSNWEQLHNEQLKKDAEASRILNRVDDPKVDEMEAKGLNLDGTPIVYKNTQTWEDTVEPTMTAGKVVSTIKQMQEDPMIKRIGTPEWEADQAKLVNPFAATEIETCPTAEEWEAVSAKVASRKSSFRKIGAQFGFTPTSDDLTRADLKLRENWVKATA